METGGLGGSINWDPKAPECPIATTSVGQTRKKKELNQTQTHQAKNEFYLELSND